MEAKQQDKKQLKTQPVSNLPVVTLSVSQMAAVSGGSKSHW